MNKFTIDYSRDCSEYVSAMVGMFFWTKEDTEITFPERDQEFATLRVKFTKIDGPGYAYAYIISIETNKGLKEYTYSILDYASEEVTEAVTEKLIEVMDDWGWFNG